MALCAAVGTLVAINTIGDRLTAEDMEEAIWDVGAYFGENDGSSLEVSTVPTTA